MFALGVQYPNCLTVLALLRWSQTYQPESLVFDMCQFNAPYRKRTRVLMWTPEGADGEGFNKMKVTC